MGEEEFKKQIRVDVWRKLGHWNRIPPFYGQGLAARQLDRLDCYLRAERVFAPPDQALYDARLKVLKDRKQLVMATPRIRDGFYELPHKIRRELWPKAVRSHEVHKCGRKLTAIDEVGLGKVDMILTGAVAASAENGARIGKGTGYGDLEYGILSEVGSVDEKTPIVTLVHDLQVFDQVFSYQPKDVSTDWILTPTSVIRVRHPVNRPKGLDWSYVEEHRELFANMRPIRELLELRRGAKRPLDNDVVAEFQAE